MQDISRRCERRNVSAKKVLSGLPGNFPTKARPTGSAARFDMALEFERELGLELWGDAAPHGEGVQLTFCPQKGNQLLTMLGRLDKHTSPQQQIANVFIDNFVDPILRTEAFHDPDQAR